MRSPHLALFLPSCAAFAALLAPAFGQTPQQLINEGAPIPGVGNLVAFEDIAAQDSGEWFARVTTTAATNNQVLLLNGLAHQRTGTVLTQPSGAALGGWIDSNAFVPCGGETLGILSLVDDGDPMTPPVITAANDRGLFWELQLLLQENDLSTAPEVSAGTPYTVLHRSRSSSAQDCLLLTRMDDPTIAGTEAAVVRLALTGACGAAPTVAAQHVLMRTGDRLLGSGDVFGTLASTEKRSFALNARGDYMFIGTFDESPIDRRVVLNGRAVLAEGQAIPGGTLAAASVQLASVDLNDLGDWAIQTRTTTTNGSAIVRGSSLILGSKTKFVQTLDPVPDPAIGPFTLTRIGSSPPGPSDPANLAHEWAPVIVTNSGDIIWYGEWNELDSGTNAGIFVNHKLVAQKGVTVNGIQIVRFGSSVDALGAFNDDSFRYDIEASPDGRYLLFTAFIVTPTIGFALLRVDLGESVPYGTLAQGCTYPYPTPNLQHVTDVIQAGLPGQTTGGFPLVNHTFHVSVDSAPMGAASTALVFTANPDSNFPCGTLVAGFEFLLGTGQQFTATTTNPPPTSFAIALPNVVGLIGQVSHAQAFFLDGMGSQIPGPQGATNALRFVFGAP